MQVVPLSSEPSPREGNSIVQSLSELRDIERQRIADERAAAQRAEAARIAAREAAEQKAREEAEARARAEEEARLAAETARAEAEREERRRIDAAAAAELARQQVALEHTRMERELELRRELVARTRPTWMVAVVVLSLAATGVLLWLTLGSRALAEEASARARLALLDRDEARSDAEGAREELGQLAREVADQAASIQKLLDGFAHARTKAEREELEAQTQRARERQRQIDERLRRERERREREIRTRPVVIPEECKRNAFGKGCPGT